MGLLQSLVGRVIVGSNIPSVAKASRHFQDFKISDSQKLPPGTKIDEFTERSSESFAYTITHNASKDWVVCFPGNNYDVTHSGAIPEYARMAKQLNCNLLVCSHRPNPSTGEELVSDAIANIQALRKNIGNNATINLYGFSLGGSVAVQAAARLKDTNIINGHITADRSFSRISSWIQHTPQIPKFLDPVRKLASKITDKIGWKMDSAAAASQLPPEKLTIITLGTQDKEIDEVTPTKASLGCDPALTGRTNIHITDKDYTHQHPVTEIVGAKLADLVTKSKPARAQHRPETTALVQSLKCDQDGRSSSSRTVVNNSKTLSAGQTIGR